jgi:soluble lytic murein transglycosylase
MPGGASPVRELRLGEQDWQRLEAWIQTWSQSEGFSRGSVEGQALVRRADILWGLGLYDEAMYAYRRFRDEITHQPRTLLALARHCQHNDVLAIVISCATRLISSGRSAGAGEPPGALWELAYPTAYGHLISAEAELQGFDPLLFLALVRQESQFHPYVSSWAGAIGLAQVMPQTGAWIAQRLGVRPFADELLLRPVVSVRFGAWYLGQALELFHRNWPAAVAAYNAGWASVSQWLQGHSLQDHDLFYETIPLSETKAFVGLVYEYYRAYQAIYQP